MKLAVEVKRYRRRNNLTQKELAGRLGITVVWLSMLENDRGKPSLNMLEKIAAEIGRKTGSLIE
jgi:transcriptional regulator with XRE-family HTH domain